MACWLVVAMVTGCSATPGPQATPGQASAANTVVTPLATQSPSSAPTASAAPALVGRWELDRTCEAIVAALTKAGHPELIRRDAGELVAGNVNGVVPGVWDPTHPCANALPPTPHSHTFWPNGTFNSYDEHDQQVDDGPWAIVDDHTFTIGNSRFTYAIDADQLRFEPVVPADCSGQCLEDLWWMYAVSYPGSAWHRVTAGQHVP